MPRSRRSSVPLVLSFAPRACRLCQRRPSGVRKPLAWLLGGFALFGFLRRRREPPAVADPRAEELRRKLEESRSIVEERDEFEGGETPVDQVEPTPTDPEERRRAVHEEGRAAAERMREGR
jgi:hypothetical protein